MDELIEAYGQLEEQYVDKPWEISGPSKVNTSWKKELDCLQLSNEDKTQQIQEKQKNCKNLVQIVLVYKSNLTKKNVKFIKRNFKNSFRRSNWIITF